MVDIRLSRPPGKVAWPLQIDDVAQGGNTSVAFNTRVFAARSRS
jgi:hypothetical protein